MWSSCCFMTKNDGFIQPRNDRDLKQQTGQLKSTKTYRWIYVYLHGFIIFFKKRERRDNMAIYLPVQRTPRFEPSVQHKHPRVWSWCWWPPWKFKLPICDCQFFSWCHLKLVFMGTDWNLKSMACITKKWYLDIGWAVGTIPQYH